MMTFTRLPPMVVAVALLLSGCSEREESGLTRVRGQVVLAESE